MCRVIWGVWLLVSRNWYWDDCVEKVADMLFDGKGDVWKGLEEVGLGRCRVFWDGAVPEMRN